MSKKEQAMVAELADDAPERETVVNRILERSKETITKLKTVKESLTTKTTKITTQLTDFKATVTDLTEKMTKIQAKITGMTETLKLKVSERKSKKDILKSFSAKSDSKVPSGETSIVTQAAIDKITDTIKDQRKVLKGNRQSKNEYFATKVTTQK